MILNINVLNTLMILKILDESQTDLVVVKQLYEFVIDLSKEQFFKSACDLHHDLSSLY